MIHSHVIQAWVGICALSTLPFMIACLLLIYRRPKIQPIKARTANDMITRGICIVVLVVTMAVQLLYVRSVTCGTYMLLHCWSISLICSVYVNYAWYTTFKFGVATERLHLYRMNSKDQNKERRRTLRRFLDAISGSHGDRMFYLKHKPMGWRSVRLSVVWGVCGCQMCAVLVQFFVSDNISARVYGDGCADGVVWFVKAWGFVMFVYSVIVCSLFVAMTRAFDGVTVRRELMFVSVTFLVASVVYVGVLMSNMDLIHTNYSPSTIVLVCMALVLFVVSVLVPLHRSFLVQGNTSHGGGILRHSKEAENELNEWQSFQKVVAKEEGFKALYDFLVSEYSVENLLFWRDVHLYMQAFDRPALSTSTESVEDDDDTSKVSPMLAALSSDVTSRVSVSVANSQFTQSVSRSYADRNVGPYEFYNWCYDLYTTYIQVGAPFEVNLPASITVELHERFSGYRKSRPSFVRASSNPGDPSSRNSQKSAGSHLEVVELTERSWNEQPTNGRVRSKTDSQTSATRDDTALTEEREVEVFMSKMELRQVWDEAYQSIEELLTQDAFPRFVVQSDYIQRLRTDLQRVDVLGAAGVV